MTWLLLAAVAWAAHVEVVASEGSLHPGLPARVLVAVTGVDGGPGDRAPRLVVEGGTVRLESTVSPGIWAYRVVPPRAGEQVRFDVTAVGRVTTRWLPLAPLPEPVLEVPRVDAHAGAGEVRFRVSGPDVPPPEALRVVLGAGSIRSVEPVEGGLEVTVLLEESAFARYVPIGLLDLRRDAPPSWGGLRLRTRPRIALQTEPGTTMSLTVGGRRYGPFEADEDGIVAGSVDQYPGEMVAQAVLVDDLGNETTTALPLSSHTQPALVALPSGAVVPGRPPPVVYLRGVHGDGHPWQGADPACRTAVAGELGVRRAGPGEWILPLAELDTTEPVELRVHCSLGGAAETSFRVGLVEGLAARLRLRVWPEELSTDFPAAEVQVLLEDALGERLPVDGVTVEAEHGEVVLEAGAGFVLRGEYRGKAAVEHGQDILRARYRPPLGAEVARLSVGHGAIPDAGEVAVHGRALDLRGRPVPGVDLALSAGGGPAYATTGEDGWASAVVPVPEGTGAVVLEVRQAERVARALALRGAEASSGPGVPDLSASRVVPITSGRVAEMFLTADPPVLYTGASAVGAVRIGLVDRVGKPIEDAVIEVSASEGTVGPVRETPDGYRAEYLPPPGDRPREVTLVARYEGTTATTHVLLEPRPIERALGVAFGGLTNFGEIGSPLLAVDLDWRLPWFGGAAMLRLGVATYGDAAKVTTGLGEEARIRLSLYPVTVGLLGRRDMGGRALWLGIAAVVAPYSLEARFGDDLASRGLGVLPPGLELIGGVGQRFGGGEAMFEVRALTLSSPGGPIAYQGPVGGVAAVLGYRLSY